MKHITICFRATQNRRRISSVAAAPPRSEALVAAVSIALAFATATSAHATSLVRLSLEQLTQASSTIVRGRVVGQESHWNASHTRIETLTTIEPEQVVKGAPPAEIVVEQLGGTVGNIRVYVAGSVRFASGQSYFLFLEPASSRADRYVLVGMLQGAFAIHRDSQTGEQRVVEPVGGVFHRQTSVIAPEAAPRTLPAQEFRQQVVGAIDTVMTIPSGVTLPARITFTEMQGVGRLHVAAQTTLSVYPNQATVVPAGSEIEGLAVKFSGRWSIYWDLLSVRGQDVRLAAHSELAGTVAKGDAVLAIVK